MKKLILVSLIILAAAVVAQSNYEIMLSRPDIDGLTGGGATNLDGIPTTGLAEGTMVAVYDGSETRIYRLTAGTDAESSPTIIRPDDYAAGNQKVWKARISSNPAETGGADGYSLDADDGDPTDVVYVDADGKVGIGTTTPDELLHIHEDGYEYIDQQYTGAPLYLDVGGNSWQSFTASASRNLTKITIHSSTANAGVVNVILYEGEGTGGSLLQTVNGVTWAGYGLWTEVTFSPPVALTSGSQYTFKIEVSSGLPAVFHNAAGAYGGGRSSEGVSDDFNFRTYIFAPECDVVVDSDGNVGIGTTTPASKLDVGGGTADFIDGDDDVLIADDLEVDGMIYGDGSNLTGIGGKLASSAAQYVFVELADGNTDTQNATALTTAYAAAKLLTPGASNRIAVIVPPGRYDLGTAALTLDTEYIDLVGLTTDRTAQFIYGTANGSNTGVLMQTADNLRIENLTLACTSNSGSLSGNNTDPATYFPNTNLANTVVRNCVLTANDSNARTMRLDIEYSGAYTDVTTVGNSGNAGECTFGGAISGSGIASGTFTRCTGYTYSFGGACAPSSSGTVSGTFTDCVGGNYSFGGSFNVSTSVTISGSFTHCTGGLYSFGGTAYGTGTITAAANFSDCTGGNYAFGGAENGCAICSASGTFTDCTGGNYSFGATDAGTGTASGTFTGCVGGDYSFGGANTGSGSAAGGRFYFCRGGVSSLTDTGAPLHRYCDRNGTAEND